MEENWTDTQVLATYGRKVGGGMLSDREQTRNVFQVHRHLDIETSRCKQYPLVPSQGGYVGLNADES